MLKMIKIHESKRNEKKREKCKKILFELIETFKKEYEENCKTMKYNEIFMKYSHIMILEQTLRGDDVLYM